ncbi:MAG: hypothetical protein ACYDAY_08005 [Candidatus Dormibacteria bacterium]
MRAAAAAVTLLVAGGCAQGSAVSRPAATALLVPTAPAVAPTATTSAIASCPREAKGAPAVASAPVPAVDDLATASSGGLWIGDDLDHLYRWHLGSAPTPFASLRTPEGIAELPDGRLAVALQAPDQVVLVDPAGAATLLLQLRPVAGRDGVDGIALDHDGRLLVPDSPRGNLLSVGLDGSVRTIASGLGRPVGAARLSDGEIAVADEQLGLVLLRADATVARTYRLNVPDDVIQLPSGRLAVVTLGDSSLWSVDPATGGDRRVQADLGQPQGLALDGATLWIGDSTGRRLVGLPVACLD